MLTLYTDGGVIRKNPSPIGGTYAWILLDGGSVMDKGFGTISPDRMGTLFVTNNQTELYAVLKGLDAVYKDEVIKICSDSQITLGRLFEGYAFNNIPKWMKDDLVKEQNRLSRFFDFSYELLDGHPTKAQIKSGTGKRGHPTSEWNVWCDKKCNEAARIYLEELLT